MFYLLYRVVENVDCEPFTALSWAALTHSMYICESDRFLDDARAKLAEQESASVRI